MGAQLRNAFPVYELPSKLRWIDVGKRVRLDELIAPYTEAKVYRYCTLAEALMLLREGLWAFLKPTSWPDVYERHVGTELFGDSAVFEKLPGYIKCVSLEYSSEAMWRTYSSTGGLVRLSWKLSDLIDVLNTASFDGEGKVYVGVARYVSAPVIRAEVGRIKKTGTKVASQQAMRVLMMKRFGFASENEIRICFFPGDALKPLTRTATFSGPTKVDRMLIDPYLVPWQANELVKLFRDELRVPFSVTQSQFDTIYDSDRSE
jgi:hypothetical protein